MNAIERVFDLGDFDKLVIDAYPSTWFRNGEPFSLQEWPEGSEMKTAMQEAENYIDEYLLDNDKLVITIARREDAKLNDSKR